MIKENEKEIALQISSKLEYLIKTERVKANEIAVFIGIAKENFSRGRNLLKKGKLPPSYFLMKIFRKLISEIQSQKLNITFRRSGK